MSENGFSSPWVEFCVIDNEKKGSETCSLLIAMQYFKNELKTNSRIRWNLMIKLLDSYLYAQSNTRKYVAALDIYSHL